MHYLGIDVHSANSAWCLLDEQGESVAKGKTPTTFNTPHELGTTLLEGHHGRESRRQISG